MARKNAPLIVGLFVTAGIIISVVTIIWLGASRYYEKGLTCVTYFDESVQGLQIDSLVKYRGVEIGSVKKIRVAPDGRLVEVVLLIKKKLFVPAEYVAQLKSAGITGIVFVELDRSTPHDIAHSPHLNFAAEYPIIPSEQSDIKQLFSSAEEILHKMATIDFKGLSDQFKSAGKSFEATFTGPRMKSILAHADSVSAQIDATTIPQVTAILANVEQASQRLDTISQALATTLTDGRVDAVVTEAKGVMTDARSLIARIKTELEAMKLAETGQRTNRMAEQMEIRARVITQELITTSDNLRQASEKLDEVIQRVRDTPSELLFSKPPVLRRAE